MGSLGGSFPGAEGLGRGSPVLLPPSPQRGCRWVPGCCGGWSWWLGRGMDRARGSGGSPAPGCGSGARARPRGWRYLGLCVFPLFVSLLQPLSLASLAGLLGPLQMLPAALPGSHSLSFSVLGVFDPCMGFTGLINLISAVSSC